MAKEWFSVDLTGTKESQRDFLYSTSGRQIFFLLDLGPGSCRSEMLAPPHLQSFRIGKAEMRG